MKATKKYYMLFSLFTLILCLLTFVPVSYAETENNQTTDVGIRFSEEVANPGGPEEGLDKIPGPSTSVPPATKPGGTLPQTGEIVTLLFTILGFSVVTITLLFVGKNKKLENLEKTT